MSCLACSQVDMNVNHVRFCNISVYSQIIHFSGGGGGGGEGKIGVIKEQICEALSGLFFEKKN